MVDPLYRPTNPSQMGKISDRLWGAFRDPYHSHPPTRAYVERRTKEGRSKLEIMRMLKRYVAREVYHHLPRV
jgi:hypothetical protein